MITFFQFIYFLPSYFLSLLACPFQLHHFLLNFSSTPLISLAFFPLLPLLTPLISPLISPLSSPLTTPCHSTLSFTTSHLSTIFFTRDKFWSVNKSVLEEISPRYMGVSTVDTVVFTVTNLPSSNSTDLDSGISCVSVQVHPQKPGKFCQSLLFLFYSSPLVTFPLLSNPSLSLYL